MLKGLPFPLFAILFMTLSAFSFRDTRSRAVTSVEKEAGGLSFIPGPADTTIRSASDTSKSVLRPFTGKPSRRAKALLRRQGQPEFSETARDTGVSRDSLRVIRVDSTARLTHFVHIRTDVPAVNVMRPVPYSLYARDPAAVQIVESLDSALWKYRVQRLVGGLDTRIPVELSLEEYRDARWKRSLRQNWETLTQAYKVQDQRDAGLGELFGQITKIEIPVPKNPLFSIFGPNIIKLQINGAVDIHSAFRNTQIDQFINSPLGNVRNEPDFQQQVQVNVKGEIGDKLKIDADWNTQRTFEYENQLRVRYTGYEDEIVKSVEAGNVSLQSNASFISSSQALFGIKAGFQFGPLALTTVASQKKGQIKELTVSGGARPTPFERRATEYSKDHYFIDTDYIPLYDSAFVNIPAVVDPGRQIREIEVWVSRVGQPVPGKERRVAAFMDESLVLLYQNDPALRAAGEFSTQKDSIDAGDYIKLEQNLDYVFHPHAGFITLNRSLQAEQAIAVAYSIAAGTIGNFDRDTSTPLIMKLVRPRQLGPQHRTAWRMMLKNHYPLGGRGIKKEGFELSIFYQVAGTPPEVDIVLPQGVRLVQMFGLDRFSETGAVGSDEKFDYFPGLTIDENRGELIFPTVEPFDSVSIRNFLLKRVGFTAAQAQAAADSFAFGAIYDTTDNGSRNSERNKFIIKGVITPTTASTYSLGFNIVEGSVDVIVNGQSAPKSDYNVDYITGQVVIRNQALLVPGTNLQIRYEANDLFQLASKTLLGARGDLNLGKNASFGFTVMNLNQQSLSDKVRLGEEPISNTIMGVDGGVNFEVPFLTRALNVLPGIQTNASSNLSFRGEAAYMSPDPNTRKSAIPQDNSSGIAYIDDFEGARRLIPFSVNSQQWKDASVPFYMKGFDTYVPPDGISIPTNAPVLPETTKIYSKAKAFWFNVQPSDVSTLEIWPQRSIAPEQSATTVLDLHYRPITRGAFNYSMDLDNTVVTNPLKNWAGIQQLLSTTSSNLLDENVNFIEFWVKIEQSQATAKLNIDLGLISEDIIPNRELNTEDGLKSGIRNGTLNEGEDVGIDLLTDEQERAIFFDFINQAGGKYKSVLEFDPSGDNFVEPPIGQGLRPLNEYEGSNGTEANQRKSYFPDAEDLNRNNNLDRLNAYFEYEIPLDTSSLGFRKYVTGGGQNSWYQIRIPINEFTRRIGEATLSTVEAVRIWVTGAQTDVHLRLTEMNLVGNQWEELVKNDSTFRVSVVNVEDNPAYTSPPGVERARDRSRPTQNIVGNEQALNLIIRDLNDGQSRQAVKRFTFRALDLFSYRAMKMFVRSSSNFSFRILKDQSGRDSLDYDAELFVRFGIDSLNFYEYRAPLRPAVAGSLIPEQMWDPQNDMAINFPELTAVKLLRDSAGALTGRYPKKGGPPGSTFQVRGQPTLTNVRFIAVGVENPMGKGASKLNGEVWVNELRLTDVDNAPGWAYRFDTGLKLADIGSVAFSVVNRDPNFHGLEEHFGSRLTSNNWTLAANVALERFLPQSWSGTSLAFSYSHVESILDPKYLPGTDILVSEAVERVAESEKQRGATNEDAGRAGDALKTRSQSLNVTETYAMPNIRLAVPVDTWLVSETINKLTFGYSYTVSTRRDPATESYENWNWNARGSYALQFGTSNYFQPFTPFSDLFPFSVWKDLKLYFTPRNINMNATLARGQVREKPRNQAGARPVVRNLSSTRSMAFSWQFLEGGFLNPGVDYQVNVSSNLVHLELDQFSQQRSFGDILKDMFFSDRLINFGIDQQYSQSVALNTRLVVPQVLKMDKILSPSLRYTSQYDWSNNIQAGNLGKGAGWSSSLTLSADISIKSISEEIWSAKPVIPTEQDTVKTFANQFDQISRALLKAPFFDFDRISITFTQQNRAQHSGVLGGNGFANIFARIPFLQSSVPENGPSFLYQLGLASDPHGRVVLATKSSFPFITGYTVPGLRAARGSSEVLLTDVFSQSNRITMRTSRSLWEGVSLDLNWNVGWSYSSNRTVSPDTLGVPFERNLVVSGDVDRSFLTLPPVLFFQIFKTSIDEVNRRYEEAKAIPDGIQNDVKLSKAFEEGLEALPLFRKILGSMFPRLNWSIRWDGLEKLPLFKSIASRASLDHSYTSNYRRRWRITPQGDELTEGQSVAYGFTPLLGLNMAFKEFLKGSLAGTFRYGLNTTLDLSPYLLSITESGTEDISMSLTYTRHGFDLPFFGLALSNDLDVSFSYTFAKNSRKLYNMKETIFKKDGTPLEGSSRTVMEPRIRYVLSARVTASFYYRYTKIKPDSDGSRIPGSTVNEGGLDVHVAIQ